MEGRIDTIKEIVSERTSVLVFSQFGALFTGIGIGYIGSRSLVPLTTLLENNETLIAAAGGMDGIVTLLGGVAGGTAAGQAIRRRYYDMYPNDLDLKDIKYAGVCSLMGVGMGYFMGLFENIILE